MLNRIKSEIAKIVCLIITLQKSTPWINPNLDDKKEKSVYYGSSFIFKYIFISFSQPPLPFLLFSSRKICWELFIDNIRFLFKSFMTIQLRDNLIQNPTVAVLTFWRLYFFPVKLVRVILKSSPCDQRT